MGTILVTQHNLHNEMEADSDESEVERVDFDENDLQDRMI